MCDVEIFATCVYIPHLFDIDGEVEICLAIWLEGLTVNNATEMKGHPLLLKNLILITIKFTEETPSL